MNTWLGLTAVLVSPSPKSQLYVVALELVLRKSTVNGAHPAVPTKLNIASTSGYTVILVTVVSEQPLPFSTTSIISWTTLAFVVLVNTYDGSVAVEKDTLSTNHSANVKVGVAFVKLTVNGEQPALKSGVKAAAH